jgi:hypothetical protein
MDGHGFDSLAKVFARLSDRRRALGHLAGGALGGIASLASLTAADAKKKPTNGCVAASICPNPGNPCALTVCDDRMQGCADLPVAYGTLCGEGLCDGVGGCSPCRAADGYSICTCDSAGNCGPGVSNGSTTCVYVQGNDPNNCGGCGQVCSSGLECCNGHCVDIHTDPHNCWRCGHVCPDGASGAPGCCRPDEGQPCGMVCNGQCVDVYYGGTNAPHCGDCNQRCNGWCDDGKCYPN